MAEDSDLIVADKPLPDRDHPPSGHPLLLLPLPNPHPSLRRLPSLAHLRHLRDLVRLLVDPRPVPQMEPRRSPDLPRPPLPPIRALRRPPQPPRRRRRLRQHRRSAERAADHHGQHRALHSLRRLPHR